MGVKKLDDYHLTHQELAKQQVGNANEDPAQKYREWHEEALNEATGPISGLMVKNTTNKDIFYNVFYEVDGRSGADCSFVAPGEFDILPYYNASLHFSRFESQNHSLSTVSVGDVITVSETGLVKAPAADYTLNTQQTFGPHINSIHILDVWGEGYIDDNNFRTGFKTAYNFNKGIQLVSNGKDRGKAIPNLLPTFSYDDPRIPLPANCARYVTLMGAPIVTDMANEMLRVVDQYQGEIILYAPDSSAKTAFVNAAKTVYNGLGQQMVDITSSVRLHPPFSEISMTPHFVYGWRSL